MSNFIKQINATDALTAESIGAYKYAILNMMSSLELAEVQELTDASGDVSVNSEELLEARFFSNEGELHIYRDNNDELAAVQISDSDPNQSYAVHDVRYKIKSKIGKTLVVREYLKEDEDGQMSVVLTRACGIE